MTGFLKDYEGKVKLKKYQETKKDNGIVTYNYNLSFPEKVTLFAFVDMITDQFPDFTGAVRFVDDNDYLIGDVAFANGWITREQLTNRRKAFKSKCEITEGLAQIDIIPSKKRKEDNHYAMYIKVKLKGYCNG